jgi:hypothetical protein
MQRRTASLVAVILMITATSAVAQWINYPTPGIPRTADGKPDLSAPTPKTADGKPDLTGIWTLTKNEGGISQLKPSEIKPWALKLVGEREEALNKDSPGAHCLPKGPVPPSLAKIVQTPALIVMLREGEEFNYRQIFLDGRELPKDPNPAWMGYSVGRWEGDTLVVESTGYNDRTWLDLDGHPHTESLRITERFHRADFGHITVDATYIDPGAYEKPWTAKDEFQYRPDTELLEYVCAENEKDSIHLVGKKSDDTKNAVKVAPEILSKYEGTYELQNPQGGPATEFTIALEDGELTVSIRGGLRRPMTALSDTTFAANGTHLKFDKNDKGEITKLTIQVAEGDLSAVRKK